MVHITRRDNKYTSHRCAACGGLISQEDYNSKRYWIAGGRIYHTKSEAIGAAIRRAEDTPNVRRKKRFWF
jgi:hypothetical protein